MMEAVKLSKSSLNIYRTTQYNIADNSHNQAQYLYLEIHVCSKLSPKKKTEKDFEL
jgi:hypothetical protein